MKVYLIRNGEGYYKIGRTKLDTMERLKQLQTGSATELEIVKECSVFYSSKVEAALHRYYSKYHLIGEWFCLPDDEVDMFIENATRSDYTFRTLSSLGNPFI